MNIFSATIVHAAGADPAALAKVDSIIAKIADAILNPLIWLLFVAATLIFVWGVFGYIKNGGDPKAREEGNKHILWGIVGMFIMLSVFGIINLITSTLNINPAGSSSSGQIAPNQQFDTGGQVPTIVQ